MINQAELSEDEKESWDRFVLEQGGSFLQSWEWGEFQKAVGRQIYYSRGEDYQSLIIKHELGLGKSYLYCPKGPIIMQRSQISVFVKEIENLAKQERAIFIRFEPEKSVEENDLRKLMFIKAQKDVQPRKTLILDLNKSEEELLSQMHEKTRYNIGLAERKGVTVTLHRLEDGDGAFEKFWELMNQTAKRQNIHIFPKEYYKKQLTIKSDQFTNLLFVAAFGGKAIAANLINFFGNTVIYLHGGSDNESRALMAPHLLQWEQIKEAKKRGCKFYDFWGFDEQMWPGVSRFKKGFNGREVEYMGAFDLIMKQAWYSAYIMVKKVL